MVWFFLWLGDGGVCVCLVWCFCLFCLGFLLLLVGLVGFFDLDKYLLFQMKEFKCLHLIKLKVRLPCYFYRII